MRGMFQRSDGLILPNNLSLVGKGAILGAALRDASLTLYACLVEGAPSDNMTFADMVEPTVGVNGYARVPISRDETGWPIIGISGSDCYAESMFLTFTPTGGAFDKPIQRVAIATRSTYVSTDSVVALSAALPAPLTIDTSTPIEQRQFKYRIYS